MGSKQRTRRDIGSTIAFLAIVGVAAMSALVLLGGSPASPVAPPSIAEGRIPPIAHEAYVSASAAAPTVAPGCSVHWTVIAGIAQVESDHGRTQGDHAIDSSGDVVPPIRGVRLDGTRGTAEVPDTDDGTLDGDTTWDRALGPLQFIPTRWRELGRDADGDGTADPDNIFDAALTAVAHLCIRSPGDYADLDELRAALLTYNPSQAYADDVLAWIDLYRSEPLADILESPDVEADG